MIGGDRGVAANTNALILRDFVVDPPTLINLGFEWFVDGDANRNAVIDVSYRHDPTQGGRRRCRCCGCRVSGSLREADRCDVAEHVRRQRPGPSARHGYEVRFQVSDPDGVVGQRTKIVRVRTRPEPKPAADGRTFHVYPPNFKGAKTEPSFEGLMCAYNLTVRGTDWATAGRPRVQPGDTILVHAGVYKYNRLEYTNDVAVNRTVPLDGTYYLTADGTAERPIAIKGAATATSSSTAPATSRCST
jgi:hypothetical protein